MLAMEANDNAGCLNARVVSTFFASMLAPTGSTRTCVGAKLAIDGGQRKRGLSECPRCQNVFREQARSHSRSAVNTRFVYDREPL